MRPSLARPIALRVLRPARRLPVPAPRALPQALPQALLVTQSTAHFRSYSQQPSPTKVFSFEDVKAHIANPTPNRILIDTREPAELQETGTIPGSINIPIKSKPDSFHITGEEFEDRFGFERPGKDQEIVVYCKAGVRSRAAAELARQQGWVNVIEYEGSWLDWEKNGGKIENVR